ncbi:heat shock 70 kDa protein 16-like [Forsythia ovata]|uniref:Heat shock 70 kDa protein 16-like n=1 Tax=Forsythia ovata TaxID=205694 RepID=A0ABD1QCS1_9LAMI
MTDVLEQILNTYRSFATDSERKRIASDSQQTEEWLYEEGDDESEFAYTQKLEDLKKMVDPIEHRYKEEEARTKATRSLLNFIVEYRMAAGSLPPTERDELSFAHVIIFRMFKHARTAKSPPPRPEDARESDKRDKRDHA